MTQSDLNVKYPPLSSSLFNQKKFKKHIKKSLEQAIILCRLKITSKDLEYSEISKSICAVLIDILSMKRTYSYGNLYFLLAILGTHLDFLQISAQKTKNIISMETLENIHTEIIDQHKVIRDALIQNLRTPVTYHNLPEALGLDTTNQSEDVISES